MRIRRRLAGMADMKKMPKRCDGCQYNVTKEPTSYFPYPYCTLAKREIHYCPEEGQYRMNWCPFGKDGEQDD
jgi:hypothetical protein